MLRTRLEFGVWVIALAAIVGFVMFDAGGAQVRMQPGSAADVNFVTGGSLRTVTLSGNPTLGDWFDQSVKAAAAPAFATVNTGQGANELYAMDQAVRAADSPSFAGLTVAGASVSAPLAGTTGSIGGGALLAGACTSGTATVSGATTAMSAAATALGAVDPTNGNVLGVSILAHVTSANTVTVRLCVPIAGTPAATTYKVVVQ